MDEDAYRHFVPIAVEACHFCPGEVAATWYVIERETGEHMAVCDRHKFTAFS